MFYSPMLLRETQIKIKLAKLKIIFVELPLIYFEVYYFFSFIWKELNCTILFSNSDIVLVPVSSVGWGEVIVKQDNNVFFNLR